MYNKYEHPDITRTLRTGYPAGEEGQWPKCPICGKEYETLYFRRKGKEVVGCDVCIGQIDAWEVPA